MTLSLRFLALAGLIAASFVANAASAQPCHSGYCRPTGFAHAAVYEPFYVRGVLFHFHAASGGIFCDGQKVAQLTPTGDVVLLNKQQPVGGVAVQAGAPGVAVGPNVGPAGGPAVGVAARPGVAGGAVIAGQPGVAGQPAPIGQPGQPGPGIRQGGAISAPVAGQVPPVSPIPAVNGAAAPNQLPPAPPAGAPNGPAAGGPAPAEAVPAPQPGNPTIPGPVAGAGLTPPIVTGVPPVSAVPAINVDQSLLAGEWQAKTEDLAGRSTIRRLAFESEGNVTLRLQTSGEEPFARSGKFVITGGSLMLTDDEGKLEIGQIASLDADKMIIRTPEGLVNFARP